jgi:heat shock transcription factor
LLCHPALHQQTAGNGVGTALLKQNLEIAEVIGWTSSGDSFNIRQVGRFTEEVLPRYFKHRNFSSFIRQLNMYGFRKTRHPDGDNVYMHDHFQRGHKHLLRHITRRMREER